MPKTNYNGTATAGATKQIALAVASRVSMFFKPKGADMVLNFGADATSDNILTIKDGESIYLTKTDPYPIEQTINVFCASATKYDCQIEE